MGDKAACKWDSKKLGWVIPRPIYKVWWMDSRFGVTFKTVVADNRGMAIRKAKRKWAKHISSSPPGGKGVGAKLLFRKGLRRSFYAPPSVDLL